MWAEPGRAVGRAIRLFPLGHRRCTSVPGMQQPDDSRDDNWIDQLRPVDVRRAILGVFLRSGRPMSLSEVSAALAAEGLTVSRPKISDVMMHQVRAGRAQALARGVFVLDPDAFSESTRGRCLQWRAAKAWRERQYARYRSAFSGGVGGLE